MQISHCIQALPQISPSKRGSLKNISPGAYFGNFCSILISLWVGTGGSEPPASRTLLSHFPYLYLPAPPLFSPSPVPYKLGDSKHILVREWVTGLHGLLVWFWRSPRMLNRVKSSILNRRTTISDPHLRYQARCIRFSKWSSDLYQDIKPLDGKYETADLPYQAPTYDIKPFELNRRIIISSC